MLFCCKLSFVSEFNTSEPFNAVISSTTLLLCVPLNFTNLCSFNTDASSFTPSSSNLLCCISTAVTVLDFNAIWIGCMSLFPILTHLMQSNVMESPLFSAVLISPAALGSPESLASKVSKSYSNSSATIDSLHQALHCLPRILQFLEIELIILSFHCNI